MAEPFKSLFDKLYGEDTGGWSTGVAQEAAPGQPPRQMVNPQQDFGLIGNISRSIYGPSAGEVELQQKYALEQGRIQSQNTATGKILQRLQVLKTENPELPQNALFNRLIADPVFIQNFTDVPTDKIFDMVNSVQKGLFGEEKYVPMSEGQSLLQMNPEAGRTAPMEVYSKPKTQKPWEVTRAVGMRGNDPRLKGHDLPADKHFEVTYGRDAFGEEYIKNLSSLNSGVNVTVADRSQETALKSRLEGQNALIKRQHSVMDAVRIASRIEDLLDQEGAGAIGATGLAVRIGQAIGEQVPAALKAMTEMGISRDANSYNWSKFKGLNLKAQGAAAIQSNLLALAFKVAQANSRSGNVTGKEVEQALDEIGAKFGSTVQMRAALREMVGRSVQSYDDAVDIEEPTWTTADGKATIGTVKRMRDMLPERGLGHYIMRPRAGSKEAATEAGAKPKGGVQIPRGHRVKDPVTGQWMLFTGGQVNSPDAWEVDKDQTDR